MQTKEIVFAAMQLLESGEYSHGAVQGILQSVFRIGPAHIARCIGVADKELKDRRLKNALYAPTKKTAPSIEAVQIEWITNGVLARYKGPDGPVCAHFRDINHFIAADLGGAAERFTLNKKPKVGDTCIVYFGMSESASE